MKKFEGDALGSHTSNKNGSARFGWNGKTLKWETQIYPKDKKYKHKSSILYKPVWMYYTKQCEKYDIK